MQNREKKLFKYVLVCTCCVDIMRHTCIFKILFLGALVQRSIKEIKYLIIFYNSWKLYFDLKTLKGFYSLYKFYANLCSKKLFIYIKMSRIEIPNTPYK